MHLIDYHCRKNVTVLFTTAPRFESVEGYLQSGGSPRSGSMWPLSASHGADPTTDHDIYTPAAEARQILATLLRRCRRPPHYVGPRHPCLMNECLLHEGHKYVFHVSHGRFGPVIVRLNSDERARIWLGATVVGVPTPGRKRLVIG